MKSSRLFFYLKSEWAFRKNPKALSSIRRMVQRIVREERQERVRGIDEKIEQFKAEKLLDGSQARHKESDDFVEQVQNEEQDSPLEDEPKFDEQNEEPEDSEELDVHSMDKDDFDECRF